MIWNSLAKFTKLLPGEAAHNLAVTCLSLGLHPRFTPISLPVKIGGVTFPNPVGLAAGFDKNASAISGSFALGFGSVEIGTVTPLPQPGTPNLVYLDFQKMMHLLIDMGLIVTVCRWWHHGF